MLKSQRMELEILQDALTVHDPAGRPTTLPQLYTTLSPAVACSHAELVDAMKRLHAEQLLRLRKWDNRAAAFLEYQGDYSDEEFFYRGDFRLLVTPHGRTYYERLSAEAEDEPKPRRPIGFTPRE